MSKRHFFKFPSASQTNSQSGQVAVIVFLIMAVLLVVGLSLATRTSQEVELAGQQEDTTRVFNAAETGIEEALSEASNFTGGDITGVPQNDPLTNTSRTVSIDAKSGFQNDFDPGETATIFINPTASSGTITIDWGNTTTCNATAALVITVYRSDGTATHQGVRSVSCWSGTQFAEVSTDPPADAEGNDFARRHQFTVTTGTEMVRIKPLYNSTAIKVSGSMLAPQEYDIRSQAQDTQSGNTEVRAIEVTRSKPAPPSILDYALYSGGDLAKN